MLGDDEPLVSHSVESEITVLKKDSLLMNKVSKLVEISVVISVVESLKLS